MDHSPNQRTSGKPILQLLIQKESGIPVVPAVYVEYLDFTRFHAVLHQRSRSPSCPIGSGQGFAASPILCRTVLLAPERQCLMEHRARP